VNAQALIGVVVIVGLLGWLGITFYQLGEQAKTNDEARRAFLNLVSPPSLVSLLILLGVLFLLGMAILDLDKGRVLVGMGKTTFARGLITYLFAIVTIGTAVVLVLSALLGTDKAKFDSGKEVLGLLLGVFGTIVGFYFASELAQGESTRALTTSVLVSPQEVAPGGSVTATVAVQGGRAPYLFATTLDGELPSDFADLVRPDGWIVRTVMVPADTTAGIHRVRVGVQDSGGERTTAEGLLTVKSAP